MSEPKIRGYRKRMLSLWIQKGMFLVSEQRLVDQVNTIRRNSWMTELEIEELERKVTGSKRKVTVIVEVARSVEALPGHVGEVVRNVLPQMGDYQLLEMCQRRNYWRRLLRLIKFLVSLKLIVLQRLMNCSMQELLLLQID